MTDIPNIFREAIQDQFDGFLGSFGFVRTSSNASEHGFSVTYRNGECYVNIGGTLHPHDYPYYTESDWNATALWRIVQEIAVA